MSRLTLRPLTLLLVLFLCQRNLLLTVANDEINPVSSSSESTKFDVFLDIKVISCVDYCFLLFLFCGPIR